MLVFEGTDRAQAAGEAVAARNWRFIAIQAGGGLEDHSDRAGLLISTTKRHPAQQ
jgi:hypothetical protein